MRLRPAKTRSGRAATRWRLHNLLLASAVLGRSDDRLRRLCHWRPTKHPIDARLAYGLLETLRRRLLLDDRLPCAARCGDQLSRCLPLRCSGQHLSCLTGGVFGGHHSRNAVGAPDHKVALRPRNSGARLRNLRFRPRRLRGSELDLLALRALAAPSGIRLPCLSPWAPLVIAWSTTDDLTLCSLSSSNANPILLCRSLPIHSCHRDILSPYRALHIDFGRWLPTLMLAFRR